MAKAEKKGRQRANGEGSISNRKDGRKDVELTVRGPFGENRLRTTKKNRTEALAWIEQMKRDYADGGLDLKAKTLTVGEYLDLWIQDSVEGVVSRHTYSDYESKVRLHLNPTIGHLKLQSLTSAHLQALYRRKQNEGQSPRSVGYIHTTIRKALAQAEAWDLVKKNVARFAKPPKASHSEPDAMTVEEARRFLQTIKGNRLEALYLLAVTTGLRRGELLGLKWTDLNLDHGHLRVERSLDTLHGPAVENDPKRKASRRPAVLQPPVVAELKAHRARQTSERLAAGPAWREHGYIFPTRVGTPERGDNVLKRSLGPLAVELGDPTLNFQKLRRSHSTFYAILNVHPRVAQMSMGHGSFETTMKYYTGVPSDLQKQAAEALGKLLFEASDKPAEDSTPVTLPSDPEKLAALKLELEEKLLQIQEFEERARQDSNLRPPDS